MQHYSLLLKNFMTHKNDTDLESDPQNSDVILKQLKQRKIWFGFLFLSLVVHRCLEVYEQCFFYKLTQLKIYKDPILKNRQHLITKKLII